MVLIFEEKRDRGEIWKDGSIRFQARRSREDEMIQMEKDEQAALPYLGRASKAAEERGPIPFSRWWTRHERAILGFVGVATILGLWEGIAAARLVDPLFLSAPSRILRTGAAMFASGEIWPDLQVSGLEFAAGYGMALIGIPLGILLGWYRRLYHLFDPILSALYATPRVALLPLLIIWLGIGIWSKIAVVFLGAVFPILLSTVAAVRTVDVRLLRAAHSFGASDLQIFRTIVLPGSVPFIITGLRLGVGRALVGVVVGEMLAATAGIGLMISIAGNTFQTDRVFVGIFLIAAAGVVLVEALTRLERRFEKWRPPVGLGI